MYILSYNCSIDSKLQEKYIAIAQDYSNTIVLLNSIYAQFYLKHIPRSASMVLDVGCGSGDILLALSRKFK